MRPEAVPQIDGRFARLRPVAESDAEFLFKLRNNPKLTRFVNDGPATMADQRAWLRRYFAKEDDCNFIVHSKTLDRPVGTIALYDIQFSKKVAEYGRWLVLDQPRAAIEADLLIQCHAFDTLGLDRLVFGVLAANVKVVNYHIRYGARQTGSTVGYFQQGGVAYDALFFEMDRQMFFGTKKPMLEKKLYAAGVRHILH
jgi:RimJ/RimL family protein N-acetyltransferase